MIRATMAATALSSVSNFLAQFLEAYRDNVPFVFDIFKFIRFVLVTLIDAPPNYKWQQFLENSLPGYEHSSQRPITTFDLEKQSQGDTSSDQSHGQRPKLNLRNTIAKAFIDCTIGAVLNTVAFFIMMGLFKRQPVDQIFYNVRHDTIAVIVDGSKIWPLASLISFSCVPVERRIVFLSFVNLIWGVYMSLLAART